MKSLLLISALATMLATAQDAAAPRLSITPVVHGGTEKFIDAYTAESKKGEARIVFLGDSITQGWNGAQEIWKATWGDAGAVNFGIGGDRTEHVLWRMDHGNIQGLKPKLVVLMIGTNNTGHRKEPAQDTADGIRAILDKLKTQVPGAKVLLLGIFPRGATATDEKRVQNTAINGLISKFDDGKTVHFLDISQKFLAEDGTLSKEIMPDLLHLSKKGYQIWADSIKDKVAELSK